MKWGIVLYIVRYSAISLASTYYIPVAPLPQAMATKNVFGHSQISTGAGDQIVRRKIVCDI